ncbi:MAG: glycosyltransferase [Planctomycetota bacterium]
MQPLRQRVSTRQIEEWARGQKGSISPGPISSAGKDSWGDTRKRTTRREDVCVIVTCHNYGRFLKECLDSILAQTYPPAEVLVILDACTDDSGMIAGQYRGQGVRTVAIESRDVYLARRAGLARTASPLVMFVDADDILPPTYVADLVPGMADPRVGIVTGKAENFGLTQGTWDPRPDQTDFEQRNGATASSLVRRRALDDAHCFQDWTLIGTLYEDWATWREIVRAGYRVAKVNTGYRRRIHGTNATIHVYRPDLVRVVAERPRVLHVGPCLGVGGAEHHLLMLLRGQRRVEWHAGLVHERGYTDDVAVGHVLKHMPVFGGSVTHDIASSRLVLREGTDVATLRRLEAEADVIYAWGATQAVLADTTLPVVYGVHCSGDAGVSSTAAVAPLATAIISLGEYATSMVPVEHRHKVVVIPNGVDLHRLAPTRDRESMLSEWGVPAGHHAIGFVGRWSSEKSPMALAEAVHALGSKFHAVYCGPQQGGIGQAVPAAERERAEHLCAGRITWTYTENVGDVYAALSALLLPSASEVCSLTAIEAMASGCPLVATPAGHLPELERRFPGIVEFVPFAPTGLQLANAVRQMLTPDGQARAQLAQRQMLENFTARRMVEAWEDVLIRAALK